MHANISSKIAKYARLSCGDARQFPSSSLKRTESDEIYKSPCFTKAAEAFLERDDSAEGEDSNQVCFAWQT